MKTIMYYTREAQDAGYDKHPQLVMEELGIKYYYVESHPIGDCFQFWINDYVTKFPSFIKEIPYEKPPLHWIFNTMKLSDTPEFNEIIQALKDMQADYIYEVGKTNLVRVFTESMIERMYNWSNVIRRIEKKE